METPITLPFIFWNKNSQDPDHKILSIALKNNYIATGSETGEVCIWKLVNDAYCPQIICTVITHCKCLCLDFACGAIPELVGSSTVIVSLHADNKIRLWDVEDGRCTSVSSSTLLPNYVFNLLLCIQQQFVAVAGENSDIMLVDLWSMERISYFSMSSSVLSLELVGDNELWALDINGKLRKFYIPLMKNYFCDQSCIPEVSNLPSIDYNVKEEVVDMKISKDGEFIVVRLKHGLRIYWKNWVLEGWNEYAHIEERNLNGFFCGNQLLAIVNDKIIRVSFDFIKTLLIDNNENSLCRENSITSVKVHSIPQFDQNSLEKIDSGCVFSFVFEENLVGFKENSIILYDFITENTQKFTFSFKNIGFEWFSDMQIHHMLTPEEKITCSLTYLTSEWPLSIMGTSLGKIFICSFHPSQSIQFYHEHTSAITCIYIRGDKMVSCCKNHLMCLWEIESSVSTQPQDDGFIRDRCRRRSQPLQSNRLSSKYELKQHKPVITLHFFFGSISKIIRIDGLRDDKSIENVDLILAQGRDNSIILVSLLWGKVLGIFTPIPDIIKEAFYQSLVDYLYVMSEQEKLYIFNIEANMLERVVTGSDIYMIIRKPTRKRIETATFEEVVEETSPKQKITMFNLRQLFPAPTLAALKVSTICIGNSHIPFITINVLQIVKKIKKVESPSSQLEYILSLLTCWIDECNAHKSLCDSISRIISMSCPAIRANIGTIGVGNTMSFSLPGPKSSFEISSYITALIMSAGYSIVDALSKFIPSKKKRSRVMTGHLLSPVHSNTEFKNPFLTVLAIQCLSGITTSRFILQDNLTFLELRLKERFLDTISSFIEEQWSVWKTGHIHNVNKNYVGLMEALCASLLGYAGIEFKTLKKEILPMVLNSLRSMLKTNQEGYIISAANILGKGIKYWKTELTNDQVKEIVKELLLYGCKEDQAFKPIFFKALINITVSDFLNFIEILSQEIENIDIDPYYPSSCIQVLDLFIEKKYDEVVSFLPAVVDLIVRTLNPHNPMLRKTTIDKAGHTLKTLIIKLPMVAFCQIRQRLAIGTMENSIIVYDLKTASIWKTLMGHNGPVCAVEFNSTGEFLVSYCSIDCSVKIWKLKHGFIQDLIGSNTGKPIKNYALQMIQSVADNYKKFLDTVKLSWAHEDAVHLVREDGLKNIIKI